VPAGSERPMEGSATFTTVESSMTMSWAAPSTAMALQDAEASGACAGGPGAAERVRVLSSMAATLCMRMQVVHACE